MLHRIIKKTEMVTNSLTNSINLSGEQNVDESTSEGFLCPMCMEGFGSQGSLEQHWSTSHSPVQSRPDSPSSTSQLSPKSHTSHNDIGALSQQLASTLAELKTTREAKKALEVKAASMAQDLVKYRSNLDEKSGEIGELRDQLNTANSRLRSAQEKLEESASMEDDMSALRHELGSMRLALDESTAELQSKLDGANGALELSEAEQTRLLKEADELRSIISQQKALLETTTSVGDAQSTSLPTDQEHGDSEEGREAVLGESISMGDEESSSPDVRDTHIGPDLGPDEPEEEEEEKRGVVKQAEEFTAVKESMERLCAEKDSALQLLQTRYSDKEAVVLGLEQQVESLEARLATPCAQCGDYERRLVRLQRDEENTQKIHETMKSQLEATRSQCGELLERVKCLEDLLASTQAELETERSGRREVDERLEASSTGLSGIQDEYRELKEEVLKIEEERDRLARSLESLRSRLGDGEKSNLQLETTVAELTRAMDAESQRRIGLQSALEKEREKVELLDSQRKDEEEEREELKRKLTAVNLVTSGLRDELNEKEAMYEDQLSIVNRNLSTVRQELELKYSVIEDQTLGFEETRLELKAARTSLEASEDQRTSLAQRLLEQKAEFGTLEKTLIETKWKLKEAETAIFELGREHQSMQVDKVRLLEREWRDDKLVPACMKCHTIFTAVLRKHHCRSCGNVYCHVCSAHTASLPSYSKPVRVCDSCAKDLNKL